MFGGGLNTAHASRRNRYNRFVSWLPRRADFLEGYLRGIGVIGVYVGDQMISAADLETNATLYAAQQSVIETFQLGVTLCKIIVIVSVASIVFVLLQKTGLIPAFGNQ